MSTRAERALTAAAHRIGRGLAAIAAPFERRGWIRAMSPELRAAFEAEVAQAEAAFARGDDDEAVTRFGRGHILGSYFCTSHFLAHAGMLRVAVRRARWREASTQALRLAGTFGTRLFVPFFGVTGNPGSGDRPIGARYALPVEYSDLLARQKHPRWRVSRVSSRAA